MFRKKIPRSYLGHMVTLVDQLNYGLVKLMDLLFEFDVEFMCCHKRNGLVSSAAVFNFAGDFLYLVVP